MKKSIFAFACMTGTILAFIQLFSCEGTFTLTTNETDEEIEDLTDSAVTFLNIDGMRNGDLDGDDRLTTADLELFLAYLKDIGESPGIAADLDGSGFLDERDFAVLTSIFEGKQPHIISADWIEGEEIGTGMLELLIMSETQISLLEVNGIRNELIEAAEIEPGIWFVSLIPSGIDTSGTGDLTIIAYNESGKSTSYTTYFLNGTESDIEFDNKNGLIALFKDGADEETVVLKTPNDCCIKEIKLKILLPGLVYDGFTDQGKVELKQKDTKVVPVGKVGTVTLPGAAHYFTIRLFEVGRSGTKITSKSVPFFAATFNCDNLKKGVIKEVVPKSDGDSQVRARDVLEVVDFTLQRPCPKGTGKIETVNTGFFGGDNLKDTTTGRFGSGVNFKVGVDYSQLTDAGCNSACWTQYVQTIIEIKRKGKKKFKEVLGGPLHIDHTVENADDLWFCYPIQQTTLKNNGQRDQLVMRDYPHIKHAGIVCTDKGKLILNDGDVVRRRSVFYPQLICIDPKPFKVLASFTYTLTTEYSYMKGDLSKGGASKVSPLSPYPYTKVPSRSDKKKLREFLKKKERREKKCK